MQNKILINIAGLLTDIDLQDLTYAERQVLKILEEGDIVYFDKIKNCYKCYELKES